MAWVYGKVDSINRMGFMWIDLYESGIEMVSGGILYVSSWCIYMSVWLFCLICSSFVLWFLFDRWGQGVFEG